MVDTEEVLMLLKRILFIFLISLASIANAIQNFGDQVIECLANKKAIPETPMFEILQKQCEQIIENKFKVTKRESKDLMGPALNANICVTKKISDIMKVLNISAMPDCNQAEETIWRQVAEECYPYLQDLGPQEVKEKFKNNNEASAFMQGLYWGNRGMVAAIVFEACNKSYIK